MSTTSTLTDPINYSKKDDFENWSRMVIVNIYGGADPIKNKNEWGEITNSFDGRELDISFSSSGQTGDTSKSSSASVVLKNLNADTQWDIKVHMGIEVIAGYESKSDYGLVIFGVIVGITDTYESDGSVTLELDIIQYYNYLGKIIQTPIYPIGTPYKDIIEYACSESGYPLDVCAIEGDDYVTDMETSYTDTVNNIVQDLVKKANAKRVQSGEKLQSDIDSNRGFKCDVDTFYVRITDFGDDKSNTAFKYSASNGLISVKRGDIISDSSMSGEDKVVTIEAEIMFNWRIRINQSIYIESKRQPHLNGMYYVYGYDMNGSSRSGTHTVSMTLYPALGHTEDVVKLEDLYNMYRLDCVALPTSDD